MDLIRALIGLSLLVLALLILRFATEPFGSGNMLKPVSEAAGVILTGLAWGLIMWLPLRLVHGIDKAPNLLRITVYSAIIVTAMYIIYHFILWL